MLDVQTATLPATGPRVTRREDYRPPAWLVPETALDFDLDASETRVRATLQVRRSGSHAEPLRLDGGGQRPLSVTVDGVAVNDWQMDGDALVIPLAGDAHTIATEVAVQPDRNTQLMGLYASGGNLCTQCEAEGFRRITFFPDRPDVLSVYHVRMTADRRRYPVLLANGDPSASGDADDGRHWAEWHDPFPKPSYLFALVAGDLAGQSRHLHDRCRDATVQLGIWVRAADLARTDHALHALKLAMAWDERVYGREYDLDVFNIVAVDDFNFGAMENKGLNIFNSRYILADPDTATDYDYDAIAAVVAHEYFPQLVGRPRDVPRLVPALASRKASRSFATKGSPPTRARPRSTGSRRSARCAPRSSRRMPARSPIRCARRAIRKSATSTPRRSTTRARSWSA